MLTFLYIDYGKSPYIALELKYSLSTLIYEYGSSPLRVVIYTDQPETYRNLDERVSVRDVSRSFAGMTRGGAYAHRIKPCALLDALRTAEGGCVLLDSDSYILPGFAAAIDAALAIGAAMDLYEGRDPYPEAAGLAVDLPNFGRYVYDPSQAVMFNSGLVAADPKRHIAVVEDAIALIDAWLDHGMNLFKIEQIAISESFRVHGAAVAPMNACFLHYCRRSLKRYMHWRLERIERRQPEFRAGPPRIKHPRGRVRLFNYVNRIFKRY
jgi:hypothetical protein